MVEEGTTHSVIGDMGAASVGPVEPGHSHLDDNRRLGNQLVRWNGGAFDTKPRQLHGGRPGENRPSLARLVNVNVNLLYTTYKLVAVYLTANGSERRMSGTGFGIEVDEVFIIGTARHVIDAAFKDKTFYGQKLVEIEIHGKNLDSAGLPTVDTSAVISGFRAFWSGDNVTDVGIVAQLSTKDARKLKFAPMKDMIPTANEMADLSIGESLGAIGYSENYDTIDLRPLFRSGTIASDPRFPFAIDVNGKLEHRGPVVAYNGFSWAGLSGGPVITLQIGSHLVSDGLHRRPLLIGINAGHLGARSTGGHSGLSYFYRIEALLTLINEVFSRTGRPSPFDWVPRGPEPGFYAM